MATKEKKLDPLTVSAAQGYAHKHSIVIHRRRALLEFALDQTHDAIFNLTNAAAKERKRAKALEAQIEGLTVVLSSRGA